MNTTNGSLEVFDAWEWRNGGDGQCSSVTNDRASDSAADAVAAAAATADAATGCVHTLSESSEVSKSIHNWFIDAVILTDCRLYLCYTCYPCQSQYLLQVNRDILPHFYSPSKFFSSEKTSNQHQVPPH